MIKEIPILQPTYLVISYPDRLARFGLAILKQMYQLFKVQIIIAKIDTTTLSQEQQLINDVLAILTSFAGRIHRARRGTLQ
jgi:predicted site-specific integrase-resolvase